MHYCKKIIIMFRRQGAIWSFIFQVLQFAVIAFLSSVCVRQKSHPMYRSLSGWWECGGLRNASRLTAGHYVQHLGWCTGCNKWHAGWKHRWSCCLSCQQTSKHCITNYRQQTNLLWLLTELSKYVRTFSTYPIHNVFTNLGKMTTVGGWFDFIKKKWYEQTIPEIT